MVDWVKSDAVLVIDIYWAFKSTLVGHEIAITIQIRILSVDSPVLLVAYVNLVDGMSQGDTSHSKKVKVCSQNICQCILKLITRQCASHIHAKCCHKLHCLLINVNVIYYCYNRLCIL